MTAQTDLCLVENPEAKFSHKLAHMLSLFAASISIITVMTLSFRTDRSGQTVQTQIRLLLEEQSDQGLHC